MSTNEAEDLQRAYKQSIVEQKVDDDLRSGFQERLKNAFPDAETHILFISEPP